MDELTFRIIACKRRQGRPSEIQAMNGDIDSQCQDTDYLKSVELNDLIRTDND